MQDIMHVYVTSNFKKEWINSNLEKVENWCFRHSRAANSVVSSLIWRKFELIQGLINVLVTWKYQKDPMKNKREKEETPFSPLYVYGGIS